MRIVFKPMGVVLLMVAMSLIIGIVFLQQQQLQKVRRSIAVAAPLPSASIRPVDPDGLKEGVYQICSASSGLSLGTRNGSVDPNVEGHISQGPWFGNANQKWRLLRMTDGTFNIQNIQNGFWLDNTNATMTAGDFVRQWYEVHRTTNDAQKWQLVQQSDGNFEVRNLASGKVLEIHNASTVAGGLVYQEESGGKVTQKFIFKRLTD